MALKGAGSKRKKKERRKLVLCEQMHLGQTEREWKHQMPILSAGPTAESLSTVSATTDSYGAGEAVASKVVGAREREGTGDGVEQK